MRKAVPFEVTKLVSKRQAFCWRWFHLMKLFLSHTCSLKLVSSDSESDNSLSKHSSNFLPEYGPFSHLRICKQLYANFWTCALCELTHDQCLLHRTSLSIAWPFWSSFLRVCFVRLWHLLSIFNFRLFTNYSNKLQALETTGLCRINKTVHIMTIVVRILHVVRLFVEAANVFCFGSCITIIAWRLYW